jgi:hypothetical protein
MISVEYKLPVNKIVSPVLKRLNNGVEFQVISRVSAPGIIEFLTVEGYRVSLLAQHTAYANMGGITNNLKGLLKVGQVQH